MRTPRPRWGRGSWYRRFAAPWARKSAAGSSASKGPHCAALRAAALCRHRALVRTPEASSPAQPSLQCPRLGRAPVTCSRPRQGTRGAPGGPAPPPSCRSPPRTGHSPRCGAAPPRCPSRTVPAPAGSAPCRTGAPSPCARARTGPQSQPRCARSAAAPPQRTLPQAAAAPGQSPRPPPGGRRGPTEGGARLSSSRRQTPAPCSARGHQRVGRKS
mmetsp:Transcript_53296/g.117021  ORF Transcript_53296/g.117021 Transcript_53296/m.117021 type:complete len:215 (-) Transcript_53296:1153-1797(-)